MVGEMSARDSQSSLKDFQPTQPRENRSPLGAWRHTQSARMVRRGITLEKKPWPSATLGEPIGDHSDR